MFKIKVKKAFASFLVLMMMLFGVSVGVVAEETGTQDGYDAGYVEPIYYTITYVDCDGNVIRAQTQAEGDIVEMPNLYPTRPGYEFSHWYDPAVGMDRFEFGWGIYSDLTLMPYIVPIYRPDDNNGYDQGSVANNGQNNVDYGTVDGLTNVTQYAVGGRQTNNMPQNQQELDPSGILNAGNNINSGRENANPADLDPSGILNAGNNINRTENTGEGNEDNTTNDINTLLPGSDDTNTDNTTNNEETADDTNTNDNGDENTNEITDENTEDDLDGDENADDDDEEIDGEDETIGEGEDEIEITGDENENENEDVDSNDDGEENDENDETGEVIDEEGETEDKGDVEGEDEDGADDTEGELNENESGETETTDELEGEGETEETGDETVEETGDVTEETPEGEDELIGEPEEIQPERKVLISMNVGEQVTEGQNIEITGTLFGYDDLAYTLQWQYNDGTGWYNVDGANGLAHSFTLDATNYNWLWQLLVEVVD